MADAQLLLNVILSRQWRYFVGNLFAYVCLKVLIT